MFHPRTNFGLVAVPGLEDFVHHTVATGALVGEVFGVGRCTVNQVLLTGVGRVPIYALLVGVELFNRTTRSVQLTPAGEVLLLRARALRRDAQDAAAATVRAGRGETGLLRLGFTSSSAYKVLPRAVSQFTLSYPAVLLDLHEHVSAELAEGLLTHRIDVALLRPGIGSLHPELQSVRVDSEPMVIALHKQHPLAALQSIPIAKLHRLPMIGFSRELSPYFCEVLDAIYEGTSVKPLLVLESVLPTILALVEARIGAAVVPASAAVMRAGELVYRPLAGCRTAVYVMPLDTSQGRINGVHCLNVSCGQRSIAAFTHDRIPVMQ